MVIEIVLGSKTANAQLVDADDFRAFAVRVSAPAFSRAALKQALLGLGRLEDGNHGYVDQEALLRLAGSRTEEWHRSFDRMVDFAGAHGWLDDKGAIKAHVEWEIDSSIEPAKFRQILGQFATGVTVITADTAEGPIGMACNSFTSVSLDPPLVAVCPARSSETWPLIRRTGRFVVNIMASHHGFITRRFAQKDTDRFAEIQRRPRACGPGLEEAVAWIDCRLDAEHDAGDHTIVVGRVLEMEARLSAASPLVLFGGAYGTFSASSDE